MEQGTVPWSILILLQAQNTGPGNRPALLANTGPGNRPAPLAKTGPGNRPLFRSLFRYFFSEFR